ncbi:MAG: hypothetical protein HY820_17990 [Acidobacteria bacterium]|nr:hypothetical protein [Acidobacteriota bacterium]
MASTPVGKRLPYLHDRFSQLHRNARQIVAEWHYRAAPDSVGTLEEDQLFVAAARHFRPRPYAGDVLLLRRSERARESGGGPDLGWKKLVLGELSRNPPLSG